MPQPSRGHLEIGVTDLVSNCSGAEDALLRLRKCLNASGVECARLTVALTTSTVEISAWTVEEGATFRIALAVWGR